jgi:glycosyltransferase involved in cell wall biosynthesis
LEEDLKYPIPRRLSRNAVTKEEINQVKIAIVMPLGEQRGGGELMLWDLLLEGRNEDVKWLVIFLEDGPMIEKIRALGINTHIVPSGRLRQPHLWLSAAAKIALIVRKEGADIIFGWMWKANLYGGVAAMMAGLPALWYQLEEPADRNLMKRIANTIPARGVLTLSKAGQEAQMKIWPHRPTPLVYPGVELDRFNPNNLPSPSEVRRTLGLPLDGPLIGIVGRLQRWKGIHVLVEAMPKVLQKYSDVYCVVVGGKHDPEPDYQNFLKTQILELGLDDHVFMAGLQQNIPEWIQSMDIFVHASDNEPFGIVTLEAMALGKPVVAAASGGPTEIITDGVNGLLAPYGDADAIAIAILRYLDDPVFADSIGLAAQKRSADFSTQQYAQNFIAAIRDVCKIYD